MHLVPYLYLLCNLNSWNKKLRHQIKNSKIKLHTPARQLIFRATNEASCSQATNGCATLRSSQLALLISQA